VHRTIRRQERARRLMIWGTVVVVVAAVAYYFLVFKPGQENEADEQFAALATRIGCGEVKENPDEGRGHLAPGEPAPTYGSVPATSGRHSPGTLPPDIHVYDDPPPEEQGLHNLEHGYVLMYYTADALDEAPLDALTTIAEAEDQVILAPYASLPSSENLAFVAWNRALHCDLGADTAAADVEALAMGFIDQFRDGPEAPEAAAG